MRINIRQALEFFDEKKNSQTHAASIVGVIGEDLNAYAFKDYLEKDGDEVKIFDGSPTQGFRNGKRLDRWIYVKKHNGKQTLYQCEIKNWSASALGGRDLPVKTSQQEIQEISQYYWEQQRDVFATGTNPNHVTKVFLRMNPDRNRHVKGLIAQYGITDDEQKPLLIYWMPISNKDDSPFFTKKASDLNMQFEPDFPSIDIFSVSLYLRSLFKAGKTTLTLSMPDAKKRMDILNKIIA